MECGFLAVVTRLNRSQRPAETDFVYDGLSRLVEIIEKTSGTITADHAYTWCGQTRCLERDNRQGSSPVSKQYFEQGDLQGTTALYYATDRLGSVRELIDSSGAVQAQYEYDAYGNRIKVSGSKDSDLGFARLFHHTASGLDFALYRAYNSQNGRWLNRDPIGFKSGINHYSYANSNPETFSDYSGLISRRGSAMAGQALCALLQTCSPADQEGLPEPTHVQSPSQPGRGTDEYDQGDPLPEGPTQCHPSGSAADGAKPTGSIARSSAAEVVPETASEAAVETAGVTVLERIVPIIIIFHPSEAW